MGSTAKEWERLRHGLEALTRSVAEEISHYPRPITACDAQFNHLLELRRQLPHELDRLEAAARDETMTVATFLSTSPCASEAEDALRASR
jgi:hypothetical protein